MKDKVITNTTVGDLDRVNSSTCHQYVHFKSRGFVGVETQEAARLGLDLYCSSFANLSSFLSTLAVFYSRRTMSVSETYVTCARKMFDCMKSCWLVYRNSDNNKNSSVVNSRKS